MLREQVAAHQNTFPEDHPQRKVSLSYGIYTGRAVVGHVHQAHSQAYTVVGSAVNIATQLAQTAAPGQVLINGAAYERCASNIEAHLDRPILLPDQANPITVYEAIHERSQANKP
jgi:class 3 adenylate cyclase